MLLAISVICLSLASAIMGGCIVAAVLRREERRTLRQTRTIVVEVPRPDREADVQIRGCPAAEVVDTVDLSVKRGARRIAGSRDRWIRGVDERELCEDLD